MNEFLTRFDSLVDFASMVAEEAMLYNRIEAVISCIACIIFTSVMLYWTNVSKKKWFKDQVESPGDDGWCVSLIIFGLLSIISFLVMAFCSIPWVIQTWIAPHAALLKQLIP